MGAIASLFLSSPQQRSVLDNDRVQRSRSVKRAANGRWKSAASSCCSQAKVPLPCHIPAFWLGLGKLKEMEFPKVTEEADGSCGPIASWEG
jgi:hypothetical protein